MKQAVFENIDPQDSTFGGSVVVAIRSHVSFDVGSLFNSADQSCETRGSGDVDTSDFVLVRPDLVDDEVRV